MPADSPWKPGEVGPIEAALAFLLPRAKDGLSAEDAALLLEVLRAAREELRLRRGESQALREILYGGAKQCVLAAKPADAAARDLRLRTIGLIEDLSGGSIATESEIVRLAADAAAKVRGAIQAPPPASNTSRQGGGKVLRIDRRKDT